MRYIVCDMKRGRSSLPIYAQLTPGSSTRLSTSLHFPIDVCGLANR
jgi:hypothetical protein